MTALVHIYIYIYPVVFIIIHAAAEEQDNSDWLSRSTNDGRSMVQPSFDAELTHAMYGEQWVKDKASLMDMIQMKENKMKKLKEDLAEETGKTRSMVSEPSALILHLLNPEYRQRSWKSW